MMKNVALGLSCLFILLIGSCSKKRTLFQKTNPVQTGIDFRNDIINNDTLNVIDFEYIYNGGGVAVGDFNNDGLQDLFFSANQGECKLYLNNGGFTFKDITELAGINTPHWNTGVSLIDINQDGLLDIHLATAHPAPYETAPNQVFINEGMNSEGIPIFKEMAEEIGLADRGFSTQAVFFDFDNDGDLDCYVLTNALENFNRTVPFGQKQDGSGKSTDRMYENMGMTDGLPRFKDISREAGITIEGWGLGISVVDLNNDGWLDVYCANDFQSNDLMWINNQDGTFTNQIASSIQHQSANSMGMDIADINNDGLPEIVNLDMMPDDNLRQKTMFSRPSQDTYNKMQEQGYQPQFVRNSLQLNRGSEAGGLPQFSEIGYMAGIHATDWSWSALLADFDNDGQRDLYITNGYRKDVTNLDFASYTAQSLFGLSVESKEDRKESESNMDEMFGVKKTNVMYQNNGDLSFQDVTGHWGLEVPSYSNGAAYADLDNDGDLDIVVNNIDDVASVFRNNLSEINAESEPRNNYLRVELAGLAPNTHGFGAIVELFCGTAKYHMQHSTFRGYKSTMEPTLHFGLGDIKEVDSLKVYWLTGEVQVLTSQPVNRTLVLLQSNAQQHLTEEEKGENATILKPVVSKGLEYVHTESDFIDFKKDHLLPHRHSQLGPSIAIGDLNADGLEDVFIGASAREKASIFYQESEGTFTQIPFFDKISEDMGVLLFDADGDGDNDIYCVSGSSEHRNNKAHNQDRFYRNLGDNEFEFESSALPDIGHSGSVVTASDFDKDGDLDLFIGGRIRPGEYPSPPRSMLLENNGDGIFEDRVESIAEGLANVGMVTDALWSDFDNDSWVDLILVGEFMPITIFKNREGLLVRQTVSALENTVGWWNSLVAADFDNDGDIDYVAGNQGLNSVYQASLSEPICLYAKDFDGNGTIDPVLCKFINGKEYPTHYRESMTDQMIKLKKTFTTYATYGELTFSEIFPEPMLRDAQILEATQMGSIYIENLGNGQFSTRLLPKTAQLAPMFGLTVLDLNQDGNLDLLGVGNSYAPEPLYGRMDASIGTCLLGDGNGGFRTLDFSESGFLVKGDAKGLVQLRAGDGQTLILATQNQDSLKTYAVNIGNQIISAASDDAFVELGMRDGRRRKVEFSYGSSYLSQSTRSIAVSNEVVALTIVKYNGDRRGVDLASK